MLPEVFREQVCNGVDYQEVAEEIQKAGFLLTSGLNRQQKNERIKGKLGYYYAVKDTIKAAR